MRALLLALIGEQVEPLLQQFGSIGLVLVIFAETGLTTGFFLPGDSALFVGGFLSSDGVLANIWLLSAGCFVAAVAGGHLGYATGHRVGPALAGRPDSRLLRQSYFLEAEYFFSRHGAAAIMVARWIPIARTFAPMVAGASNMPMREFARWNLVGGFLWAVGLTQAGYWLGERWPLLGDRLELVIVLIIVASITPIIVHLIRRRRAPLAPADPVELAADDA